MTRLKTRRLALHMWWLWLRHSYQFRWAHRPLCARFSAGIIRLGSLHLCRSCLCTYAGLLLTALLCLFITPIRQSAAPILLTIIVPTVVLSTPRLYHHLPRPLCDLLRFSAGACIALSIAALFTGHLIIPLTCITVLLIFWRIYFTIRRTRRAQACRTCPDLTPNQICPGCQLQAQATRTYETQATTILLKSAPQPPSIDSCFQNQYPP